MTDENEPTLTSFRGYQSGLMIYVINFPQHEKWGRKQDVFTDEKQAKREFKKVIEQYQEMKNEKNH